MKNKKSINRLRRISKDIQGVQSFLLLNSITAMLFELVWESYGLVSVLCISGEVKT